LLVKNIGDSTPPRYFIFKENIVDNLQEDIGLDALTLLNTVVKILIEKEDISCLSKAIPFLEDVTKRSITDENGIEMINLGLETLRLIFNGNREIIKDVTAAYINHLYSIILRSCSNRDTVNSSAMLLEILSKKINPLFKDSTYLHKLTLQQRLKFEDLCSNNCFAALEASEGKKKMKATKWIERNNEHIKSQKKKAESWISTIL